jgi:hypothetical protein
MDATDEYPSNLYKKRGFVLEAEITGAYPGGMFVDARKATIDDFVAVLCGETPLPQILPRRLVRRELWLHCMNQPIYYYTDRDIPYKTVVNAWLARAVEYLT